MCVIHCAVPPLLLLLGGSVSIGLVLGDERIHQLLVAVVAVVALWSFYPSLRLHGRVGSVVLACFGVSLLVAAILLGHHYELSLSVLGSTLMIGAHLLNRRNLRQLRTQ